MLSSSRAVAQGGLRVPWPSPSHQWPRAGPAAPLPTSSQNTNVSFCQLPEPSIPNRKSSAPFGEVLFQALVQLPAHGGQNPVYTQLLTLPGGARPPCAGAPQPRPCSVSVLLQLVWNLPFPSLSSSFSTQPLCGLQLAAGRGCGSPPQGRPQCAGTGEGKGW